MERGHRSPRGPLPASSAELRQGPPSSRHPLKYTAPCSCLCPGSIVAFDPLSEEKADHCRAAAHARPGSSGGPEHTRVEAGSAPARPLQAPGSGRERRLGLAALSIPVLCFASKGKLLSLGPSASRRKLPSSQSRCLGLSLVRGFMALHLYLGGENTDPRPSSNCCEVRS